MRAVRQRRQIVRAVGRVRQARRLQVVGQFGVLGVREKNRAAKKFPRQKLAIAEYEPGAETERR